MSFAPFREAALLGKNGHNFWEALEYPEEFRIGLCIILGELEGGEFDWGAMAFKEPKA